MLSSRALSRVPAILGGARFVQKHRSCPPFLVDEMRQEEVVHCAALSCELLQTNWHPRGGTSPRTIDLGCSPSFTHSCRVTFGAGLLEPFGSCHRVHAAYHLMTLGRAAQQNMSLMRPCAVTPLSRSSGSSASSLIVGDRGVTKTAKGMRLPSPTALRSPGWRHSRTNWSRESEDSLTSVEGPYWPEAA